MDILTITYALTFFVAIFQVTLIIKIRKAENGLKLKTESNDFIENLENIENLETDEPSKYLWLKPIYELIGKKTSINQIMDLLRNYFEKELNDIRTLSNQGPAVGLFFTFLGLLIVLFHLGSTDLSVQISGLWPMITGSVFGIAVFFWGNQQLNRYSNKVNNVINDYLIQFLEYDKDFTKIENLDDIYIKLNQYIQNQNKNLEKSQKNIELINAGIDKVDDFKKQVESLVIKLESLNVAAQNSENIMKQFNSAVAQIQTVSNSINTVSGSITNQNTLILELARSYQKYTTDIEVKLRNIEKLADTVKNFPADGIKSLGDSIKALSEELKLNSQILKNRSTVSMPANRDQEVDESKVGSKFKFMYHISVISLSIIIGGSTLILCAKFFDRFIK